MLYDLFACPLTAPPRHTHTHARAYRYTYELRSDDLWTEIKIALDAFADPLTQITKQIVGGLPQYQSDRATLNQLFTLLEEAMSIFYSLTYQGIYTVGVFSCCFLLVFLLSFSVGGGAPPISDFPSRFLSAQTLLAKIDRLRHIIKT